MRAFFVAWFPTLATRTIASRRWGSYLLPGFGSGGLGVDADAVVFFVVRGDVAGEEFEGLVATLIENLIAGLVEVLLDLLRGGLLLVEQLGHHACATSIDGSA